MDSRILVESLLAYQAVYDEELRDAMEENGLIFGEARAPGVEPYVARKLPPLPPSKPLSGEKGDGTGYGGPKKFEKPDDKIANPGTTVPKPKKGGYGRIMSNIPYGIGDNRDRTQSNVTRITRALNNSYDLYDIILSHLLDEGYAETVEAAERIMVNMSEDWRESIFEEFEQLNEISDKKVAGLLRARDRRDIDTGAPTKEFFQRRNAHQAAARRNDRTGSNVKVDPILSKP